MRQEHIMRAILQLPSAPREIGLAWDDYLSLWQDIQPRLDVVWLDDMTMSHVPPPDDPPPSYMLNGVKIYSVKV